MVFLDITLGVQSLTGTLSSSSKKRTLKNRDTYMSSSTLPPHNNIEISLIDILDDKHPLPHQKRKEICTEGIVCLCMQ